MYEKHCEEVCRARNELCPACAKATEDAWKPKSDDTPTFDLKQMSALELMEIEAKFREEKEEK